MKPIVAIVGRPNVGKSTLFNKIVGERASIVDNVPGVTRDRLYRDTEWMGKEFLLVDTGGLEPNSKDFMLSKVKGQAEIAMKEADVIIFVVDAQSGITALDEDVLIVLRNHNKPIILAVNKIDDVAKHSELIYEFYGMGFETVIPISAEHTKNIGDLMDAVAENFERVEEDIEPEGLKIAVIGRPNAGKSSLVNRIMGAGMAGQVGLATTMLSIPVTLLGSSVGKAFYAEVSGMGSSKRIEILYLTRKVIQKLFCISLIPTILIVLFAPILFELFFGTDWVQAGVFLLS